MDFPHDLAATELQLLELINSSWKSQAIRVAAELRFADLLRAGPRSSADLAAACGAHEPSLLRLLRALVTIEICRERDDGRFELAPMGELLADDSPRSLRAWAMWWGEHLWPVWGELLYSVKTGQSARKKLLGTEGFEHLDGDPRAAEIFNRALVELTRLATDGIVRSYDFSRFSRMIDVGGGYGQLLAGILVANPSTKGVLLELPHALDGAKAHLAQAGVADRCELVAGDFFQSVPSGGDAYIIKSVIHDWDDEKSKSILQTCRRAMNGDSRLLLIERVLPDRLEPTEAHQSVARSDLNMLVTHAARERSEAEFRELLRLAGFTVNRILPAAMGLSIIDARPI